MSDISPLTAALADRYRIERELGAGGMATVYLAHDLKHGRQVALKVLRPELAAVIGADRFLAEIKTTASLQHPHILALFDSGQVDGTVFYAMPFVEGESLRDQLDREKQLPIADALRIAAEVADALQYAHEHGVIHRDIKPENILLAGGHALVADFGIALAASRTGGTRMTETGMSLGTPMYMSPEQAMGERTLDARTDVYALGAVLYEMLVGEPPFTGPTAQAIVAKVLTEHPAGIVGRRDRVPPHVEDAVLLALSKLPADRFASAAEFARSLVEPGAVSLPRARAAVPASLTSAVRRQIALAAIAVAACAAVGGWLLGHRRAPAPDGVNRFALSLEGLTIGPGLGFNRFAWAPDGRSFVYAAWDGVRTQLWIRSLDALNPTLIAGTDGAGNPAFSPDGSQIVFTRLAPLSLSVIPRAGGKPTEIVTGDDVSLGGTDWAKDGYIYYDASTTISRVHPDGSGREIVFSLDSLQREVGFGSVQALPDGRGVIARVRRSNDDVGAFTIVAFDASTKRRKRLVTATYARYVPPSDLLYVTSDGTLMASRFNLARLELTGTPVVIAHGLVMSAFGSVDLAVSSTGTLLYTAGRGVTRAIPAWVTRDGRSTPVDPNFGSVAATSVAISPDGSRIALALSETSGGSSGGSSGRQADIWVKALPAGPLARLTLEGQPNYAPRWSHDGRDILFVSNRAGLGALYRQRADGSAPARRVASLELGVGISLESTDGQWLIIQRQPDTAGPGLYVMHAGVDSVPKPLMASTFNDLAPDLSPDGRWLAYQSDESGQIEVYVRPFPDVNSGKLQVSAAGGSAPRWGHRVGELFYETPAQDMMVAQLRTAPALGVAGQQRLFSLRGYAPTYDVSPDGQRFLMLQTGVEGSAGDAERSAQLVLVEHFASELKRSLP